MKRKDAFKRAACVVLTLIFGAGFLASCKGSFSKKDASTRQGKTETAVSEEDPENILEACPYDLSNGYDWEYYPSENLTGLTAHGREDLAGNRTDIFVFDLRCTEYSNVITESEENEMYAKRGFFEADEKETATSGDYYFLRLKYDSRIELYWISFRAGYESIYIDLNEGLDQSYYMYSGGTFTDKDQRFDGTSGVWSEVSEVKEELPEDTDPWIGPDYYSELQVLPEAYEPAVITGDMSLSVNEYRWNNVVYNIYDEIETPSHVSITCSLYAGYDKTFDDYEETYLDPLNAEIKLFIKDGNEYREITPDDFTVEVYYENEAIRYFDIKSCSLGELQEGDYRFEIDGYQVDFRLEEQTYEVW